MTVLVTHSSGHLGEALVRTLQAQRREVTGIEIRPGAFTHRVGSIADRDFVGRCRRALASCCTRPRCTSRMWSPAAAGTSLTSTSPGRSICSRKRRRNKSRLSARSTGFAKYIISATTPFSRDLLIELRNRAPGAVRRHVPDYGQEYARRDRAMVPGIDRVYANEKARTGARLATALRRPLAGRASQGRRRHNEPTRPRDLS